MISFGVGSRNDDPGGVPRDIGDFHIFFLRKKIEVFECECESGFAFEESGLLVFTVVGVLWEVFREFLFHERRSFSKEFG